MALEPEARYASAAAMASALEGYLTAGDKPAAAAAGAAVAGAAVVGAAATRPTPTPIPYPPSAYARPPSGPATVSTQGTPPPPPIVPGNDDPGELGEGPPSPWAWGAGIAGILVLLLVGFLLFRFLTGGGSPSPSPSGAPVTVPSFVGIDITAAQQQAGTLGLTLTVSGTEESSLPENQIISQDPVAGTTVPSGTEISVVTARGARRRRRARPPDADPERGHRRHPHGRPHRGDDHRRVRPVGPGGRGRRPGSAAPGSSSPPARR